MDVSPSVTSRPMSTLSHPSPISSFTVADWVVRFLLIQSFFLDPPDVPTSLAEVDRFMTDPIRVKPLLSPLTSNFELEFLRRTPAESDAFRGDGGVRDAPH